MNERTPGLVNALRAQQAPAARAVEGITSETLLCSLMTRMDQSNATLARIADATEQLAALLTRAEAQANGATK
jgi:hypothetical protein